MATTLYLLDTVADTHLGTDNANTLTTPANVAWTSKALGTSRGSGVIASDNVSTVAHILGNQLVILKGALPVEWISPPVAADVTISGSMTGNMWASESNMTANVVAGMWLDVIRAGTTGTRNSNTLVNIIGQFGVAVFQAAAEMAVTTRAVNNWSRAPDSPITLNRGDRIRVLMVGGSGVMASGYTFNASWNGTSAAADGDSYVTFTENITFESAPGLITGPARTGEDNCGDAASRTELATGFTASDNLDSVSLTLSKSGTPTDDLIIEVRTDTAGKPSSTVVGTIATVSAASLTTTPTLTTWGSLGISLTASSPYWVVLRRSGAIDASNFPRVAVSSAVTAVLTYARLSSGVWTTASDAVQDMTIVLSMPPTRVYLTNTASGLSGAPALISAFTGANESPLSEGGNWAAVNSSAPALKRASNTAMSVSVGAGCSYWTPANFGPDLEAYCTIATVGGNTGVVARVQGEGGAATWDGYAAYASASAYSVARWDNGAITILVSNGSYTAAVGDKVGIRCVGSLIQCWRQASGSSEWSLVCSAVDATYPSAGKIGLYVSVTTGAVDDFYAATGSNLFTSKAWTSRGGGVQNYWADTDAGWTAPILTGEWYTPPLTAFTLTGMAVANIRALESNASANASLRCEVARVEGDGTSPTVWSSWCCAPTGTDNGELTTSEVARTINLSGDDLAITNGQRLRIRLYNEDSSAAAMANAFNVQRFYNGTSGGASGDSYVTFPQTLTEYASGPYTYEKTGYGREAA